MDFLKWLYASFDGRARRLHYWLGSLGLILVLIVLTGLLASVIGIVPAQIIGNVVAFALILPVVVKRLHDRNKPAMPWALLFLGVPAIVNLAQYLGIGFDQVEATGELAPSLEGVAPPPAEVVLMQPNALGFALLFAGLVVGLWALVELGFLRGTVGPNQYGPDPKGDALSG